MPFEGGNDDGLKYLQVPWVDRHAIHHIHLRMMTPPAVAWEEIAQARRAFRVDAETPAIEVP
jgi:hypothetical protein